MAEQHPLTTKHEEAQFISQNIKDIVPNKRVFSEPIATPRKLDEQEKILSSVFKYDTDFLISLDDTNPDPDLHGLTGKQLV